jgi:2-haloacid dehalogenase
VKALLFVVFGTTVDWRTGVAREAKTTLEPLGYSLEWLAFADAWRADYQPGMQEVRSGRIPFAKLDVTHRRMLERIRPRFGLRNAEAALFQYLNLAWRPARCVEGRTTRAAPPAAPLFARAGFQRQHLLDG